MPNANVLSEKQAVVSALTDRMKNATCGVLVNYKGISVSDDTQLRSQLRKEEVEYTVVKNTMVRRAADSLGYSALDDKLNGTTSMATTTGDPIIPLRILTSYSKKLNSDFAVKAAFMEGKVLSDAEIEELSSLSSKKDLQAQLIGAVYGPIVGLIGVLEAIIAKGDTGNTEAAAETAAEPAAEAAPATEAAPAAEPSAQ